MDRIDKKREYTIIGTSPSRPKNDRDIPGPENTDKIQNWKNGIQALANSEVNEKLLITS